MIIDDTYTQVTLQKKNKIQTIFIPTRLAKLNVKLRVKHNNKWDNDWTIIGVYESSKRNDIPHVEEIIRRHRDNTLDSQHKIKKDK